MQSSAITLVRALVMLACLVMIPLVAVFGKSLPAQIVEFVDSHMAVQSAQASQTPIESQPPAAYVAGPVVEPTRQRADSGPLSQAPGPLLAGTPVTIDQTLPREACPGSSNGNRSSSLPPIRNASWSETRSPHLVPVVRRSPSPMGDERPGPTAKPDSDFRRHGDRLEPEGIDSSKDANSTAAIEQRLQELGATYYLLESWGQDRQVYRFSCRVAIHGNPHFTRYFQDTGSDPVQAMADVLAQVEAGPSGP